MTQSNLETFIQESKARCEKATPGSWYKDCTGNVIQTNHVTRDVWHIPRVEADIDFIAHSRTDLPKALAALEIMKDALKKIDTHFDPSSNIEEDAYLYESIAMEALAKVDEILK